MNSASEGICITDDVFELGRCQFKLASSDSLLLENASQLFARASELNQSGVVGQIFNLDASGAGANSKQVVAALVSVITNAFRFHAGNLYIDGCVLLTPHNKSVLLAGASHAGKTTLTVALALKLGWRVVSEDLSIIDPCMDCLIPVSCPLSLRADASEMLASQVDVSLPPLYLNKWLLDRSMFVDTAIRPPFDLAVLLSQAGSVGEMQQNRGEFLRSLLPLSNAFEVEGGFECLYKWLEGSKCLIVGGPLKQRFAKLSALAELANAREQE